MVFLARPLVLVLVLLAGLAATGPAAATPDVVLRKIQFSLKGGATDRFLDQIRAFSTKHEFKIDITPAAKGKYSIRIARGDIRIIGSNAPDRSLFTLSFYAANSHPISQVYLDVLLIDLKTIPKKTPGVTIKASADGAIN